MCASKIERLIHGTLVREGAGVKLQRYIGVERSNLLEPVLLFDYFDSTDCLDYMAGFPSHPHRGFETVTYLLHGTIAHEDNQGHKGVIRSGDVQWMTAGKGIIHSEMPSSTTGRFQGLQLWLNLPAAEKMAEPRYQELLNEQLPVELKEGGGSIKVIAGTTDQGTSSPLSTIATKPLFFDMYLPKDSLITQHLPPHYQTLLFVLSGKASVGEQVIESSVLAVLSDDELLHIKGETDCQCLLIAAKKLGEPIVRHGPFVMNTQEEIMQAVDDFRMGRF
jgi:hypothetical protein